MPCLDRASGHPSSRRRKIGHRRLVAHRLLVEGIDRVVSLSDPIASSVIFGYPIELIETVVGEVLELLEIPVMVRACRSAAGMVSAASQSASNSRTASTCMARRGRPFVVLLGPLAALHQLIEHAIVFTLRARHFATSS